MSVESNVLHVIENHFSLPQNSVTKKTKASDVPNWDSMSNITLILKCESHFDIKLNTLDLVKLFTVGDFVDLIIRKRAH